MILRKFQLSTHTYPIIINCSMEGYNRGGKSHLKWSKVKLYFLTPIKSTT